jgi:hypothetical protein
LGETSDVEGSVLGDGGEDSGRYLSAPLPEDAGIDTSTPPATFYGAEQLCEQPTTVRS